MTQKQKGRGMEIFVRSLSEGMWVFHDPDLQKGKKHCLVAMGPDRSHPDYYECMLAYEPIADSWERDHQIKIFFEDHPSGYLHEKYACPPDKFQFFLINREGELLLESDHYIGPDEAFARLSGRTEGAAIA